MGSALSQLNRGGRFQRRRGRGFVMNNEPPVNEEPPANDDRASEGGSDEDSQQDGAASNEPDLASILSFLLRRYVP